MTTTLPPPTDSPFGEIKHGILAGGWIPFSVFLVVAFSFSFFYVRYYQHKREREFGSTAIAILALTLALLTSALVPVDIYLVSTFKDTAGHYHSWASTNVRKSVTNTVTDAYYAMYASILAFTFCIIPMAYFYFEEKDDTKHVSFGKRISTAIKYTVVALIVMGVLLCIGAFALNSNGSQCTALHNVTVQHWVQCKADFAEHSLTKDGGTNSLSFTIGVLTVIGMTYFVIYTGYGLASMPISMIRARGRVSKAEKAEFEDERKLLADKRRSINAKATNKRSTKDRQDLRNADLNEQALNRIGSRVDEAESACAAKCGACFRPLELLLGLILIPLALLLVVSLLLSSGDKLVQINKDHLSYKTGYSQATPKIINPMDKLMTVLQKVFPLDYLFMLFVVYFFLICTMSGVKHLGVRFCLVKMYDIKPRRTVPQGLLFMCIILMFTVLALNVVFLTLAPQYVTYGNQHYQTPPPLPSAQCSNVAAVDSNGLSLCTSQSPLYLYHVQLENGSYLAVDEYTGSMLYNESMPTHCNSYWNSTTCSNSTTLQGALLKNCYRSDQPCTQTRMAALLHSFFYNFWFLGAIYYWANWLFVLVFLFGICFMSCRRSKSAYELAANDLKEDFEDSDDDMAPFNPGWK